MIPILSTIVKMPLTAMFLFVYQRERQPDSLTCNETVNSHA